MECIDTDCQSGGLGIERTADMDGHDMWPINEQREPSSSQTRYGICGQCLNAYGLVQRGMIRVTINQSSPIDEMEGRKNTRIEPMQKYKNANTTEHACLHQARTSRTDYNLAPRQVKRNDVFDKQKNTAGKILICLRCLKYVNYFKTNRMERNIIYP